jgi:hypothetical protein
MTLAESGPGTYHKRNMDTANHFCTVNKMFLRTHRPTLRKRNTHQIFSDVYRLSFASTVSGLILFSTRDEAVETLGLDTRVLKEKVQYKIANVRNSGDTTGASHLLLAVTPIVLRSRIWSSTFILPLSSDCHHHCDTSDPLVKHLGRLQVYQELPNDISHTSSCSC